MCTKELVKLARKCGMNPSNIIEDDNRIIIIDIQQYTRIVYAPGEDFATVSWGSHFSCTKTIKLEDLK
jgi:tRNA(Phe) wybutosine-synthesizing methylase Tyw3